MRRMIMFFGLILLALSLSAVPSGAQTSLAFVFTSLPDYTGTTGSFPSNYDGISGGSSGTATVTSPVSGDKDKEGHAYGNCKDTEEDHQAMQAKENETEGKGEGKNCVSASVPVVHVGYYTDASGNHGFSQTGTGTTFTTINVPGVPASTQALGISSTGQIVGVFFNSTGGHGFLDVGGSFTTIDYPGAVITEATGINGSGQIVGWYIDSQWKFHGFTLLVGGTPTAIDYPGGNLTQALGISNTGQIVGWYFDSVWQAHGFTCSGTCAPSSFSPPIDYPFQAVHTEATGINSSGQIVGWYYDIFSQAHGFTCSGTCAPSSFSRIDYSLLPGAPTKAMGISDLGKIVGVYQDAMFRLHGFEATH